MRIAGIAAGAGLALAAVWCSVGLAPDNSWLSRAGTLEATQSPDMNEVLHLYALALREDNANAIRWADVGEILDNLGDLDRAAYAFEHAGKLSTGTPQNMVRLMNHYSLSGDTRATLKSALKILDLTDHYDKNVFLALDRGQGSVGEVARELASRPRVRQAYFDHFVSAGKSEEAGEAWNALYKQLPKESIAAYSSMLVRDKRYGPALDVWKSTHPDGGDALLYNGSFETELSHSPFDWELQVGTRARVERAEGEGHDSRFALRVRFAGDENLFYHSAGIQTVLAPGWYQLSAWIRADGITTNEGPRLAVFDPENTGRLNVSTDVWSGTLPWTEVRLPFQVKEETNLVRVELQRRDSYRFDSKIAGTFWLDDVRITPVASTATKSVAYQTVAPSAPSATAKVR